MISAFGKLARPVGRSPVAAQYALEVGFARKSLGEEHKAVKDYTARLKRTRDPKLRKVLTHARKEEREHAALFVRWLKSR